MQTIPESLQKKKKGMMIFLNSRVLVPFLSNNNRSDIPGLDFVWGSRSPAWGVKDVETDVHKNKTSTHHSLLASEEFWTACCFV